MTSLAEPGHQEAVQPAVPVQSPFRRFVADFAESKLALIGLAGFIGVVFIALFAPWISPQNPYDLAQLDIMDGRLPPGEIGGMGFTFILGSDDLGRDMLSSIFYGLRISLGIGVASTLVALTFGASVGLIAAYMGGRAESVIMRIVDMQLSFPAILIALILVAVMGRGVDKTLIALIIAQWAYYARTARGAALVESSKEYVEAAKCLGLSHLRIMFRHVLPNSMPPLIVVATVQVANAVSLEATLSFLGVGVPQTEPSLGMLIRNGFEFLLSGQYWISFFPGLALLGTIVAINLVGDQLRDILNPRLRR